MARPFVYALTASLLTSATAQAALVGYWRLDGNANAVTGVNGTLSGGPVAGTDRNGAAGGALSFNGALSQFASIAGGGGLNGATQGTISMWVQWNGTQDGACCGTFGNVLARQQNGVFSNNIIGLSTNNPATANVTFQGYGTPITLNAGGPVGNTYHHVAVSFAPGSQKLYVDGNLVATAAAANASLNNNAGIPLTIGAWTGDGAGFSTSNIDDLAIFDTVLSSNEISAIAKQQGSPLNTISGVTVVASSSLGGGFARNANNLVDGLELNTTDPDGAPFVNSDGGMWLTTGSNFGGQGTDIDPQLTFDLGSRQVLGGTVVYNYNEPGLTVRGVDDFRILVSDDNFALDIRDLGLFSLNQSPGTANNPGQIFDLGNVQARFVRFDIISNLRGSIFPGNLNNVDSNFVGLTEVQFFTGIIPEPATASLGLLGMAGLMLRRRRMA